MRKWGLHYFLSLLVLAVVLAGCGSGDDSNSAADQLSANTFSEGGAADSVPAAASVQSKESSAESATVTAGGQDQKTDANKTGTAKNLGTEQGAEQPSGFTGSDVAAGLNKKLIYRANLNMEVKDYASAQSDVRNMITLAGGYIIEFSENMSEYEKGGTFILKVPASGFASFLDNLEKIKNEKIQQSITGQDVSEEYVDLESRLKAKQLMENQYIEFMKKQPNRPTWSLSLTSLERFRRKSNRLKAECVILIKMSPSPPWSSASIRRTKVLPLRRRKSRVRC